MSESARVQTRAVTGDEAGLRLDRWFQRHFPQLSHGALQKLLRTGQVRIDGKRVKASDRLEAGQTIRIPPMDLTPAPKPAERKVDEREAKDLRARVLHKDADVLVIDKPAGLAVQGGTGTDRHLDGLLDALKFDAKERPRLVHRLDRDTSGVLVVARTIPAAAKLSESLRRRDARKIYWALVKGAPNPSRGIVSVPLSTCPIGVLTVTSSAVYGASAGAP